MSVAIPDFSACLVLLKEVLEEAYTLTGRRTRRSVRNTRLSQLLWGPACISVFNKLQKQLQQAVTLAHRKEGHALCMYTDASENSWAVVVIQCTRGQLSKPTEKQQYEALAFVEASFRRAQRNWNTSEKEAIAIHQTFKKLDYLFICYYNPVFTDHRNLPSVYSPTWLDSRLGSQIA